MIIGERKMPHLHPKKIIYLDYFKEQVKTKGGRKIINKRKVSTCKKTFSCGCVGVL